MGSAELAELFVRYLRYTEVVRSLQGDLTKSFVRTATLLPSVTAHRECPSRYQPHRVTVPRGNGRRRLLEGSASIEGDQVIVDLTFESGRGGHRIPEGQKSVLAHFEPVFDGRQLESLWSAPPGCAVDDELRAHRLALHSDRGDQLFQSGIQRDLPARVRKHRPAPGRVTRNVQHHIVRHPGGKVDLQRRSAAVRTRDRDLST